MPAGDELAAALALVGYGQLALSPGTAQLPAGMQADLGALGKGWAGDEAVAVLRECGVSSALLDLGGNVQALGGKADGSAWRVGIVMPGDGTNFCVLEVRDAAVVTSGNYERYFTRRRRHRIWAYTRPADGHAGGQTALCPCPSIGAEASYATHSPQRCSSWQGRRHRALAGIRGF